MMRYELILYDSGSLKCPTYAHYLIGNFSPFNIFIMVMDCPPFLIASHLT